MRKNSPRKWLHACLDLLPVILIPVFMIYSHRHTIDSGTIEVPQNQVVDFNQLQPTGNYRGFNIDFTYTDDGIFHVTGSSSTGDYVSILPIYNVDNHKVLFSIENISDCPSGLTYRSGYNNYPSVNLTQGQNIGVAVTYLGFQILGFDNDDNLDFYVRFQCFDLTQMFGDGNEPTIEQFNQWYQDDYYEYTLSHKELLKNTSTITYSDTDIMSQFTYQLYNSVDKYFNMGNVFNMTSVYDWFNLNIFNGNAPISIYIVWNIVLYEFVMDLLFLLYGLFMWFIDIVQHFMDKPFKSIK